MSQQTTLNPYSDIGLLYTNGLDFIIAALPGTPTTDDLITEVSDYIASIGAAWFGTVLTPQSIEIKSIARSAINSYINNKYLSAYQKEQKIFINEMMVPSVIDNTTLDSLKDWISATEDKVVKSNLSIEAQAPLLLATIIGETAVDYFITKVGTPGTWAPYFTAAQVSAMGNIPFWTSTGMEAALIGARTTPRGMLAPSSDAVSNEMMSALVAALTVTTGKVIFQWVPEVEICLLPDGGLAASAAIFYTDREAINIGNDFIELNTRFLSRGINPNQILELLKNEDLSSAANLLGYTEEIFLKKIKRMSTQIDIMKNKYPKELSDTNGQSTLTIGKAPLPPSPEYLICPSGQHVGWIIDNIITNQAGYAQCMSKAPCGDDAGGACAAWTVYCNVLNTTIIGHYACVTSGPRRRFGGLE